MTWLPMRQRAVGETVDTDKLTDSMIDSDTNHGEFLQGRAGNSDLGWHYSSKSFNAGPKDIAGWVHRGHIINGEYMDRDLKVVSERS